ncbi:MAG: hypothetical protein ABSD38_35095 [Syntrophorhabdales bacterium]
MFLGIDRIVESISATLKRAGARDVEAVVSDRTAQLAVDEAMDEAFTALGDVVARGGCGNDQRRPHRDRNGCA